MCPAMTSLTLCQRSCCLMLKDMCMLADCHPLVFGHFLVGEWNLKMSSLFIPSISLAVVSPHLLFPFSLSRSNANCVFCGTCIPNFSLCVIWLFLLLHKIFCCDCLV